MRRNIQEAVWCCSYHREDTLNLDDLFETIQKFRAQYGNDPAYISVSPEEYKQLMKLLSELPVYAIKDIDGITRFYGIRVRIMDGTIGE